MDDDKTLHSIKLGKTEEYWPNGTVLKYYNRWVEKLQMPSLY